MRGWFMAGSHPSQYGHEIAPGPETDRRAARISFTATEEPRGFGTLMQMFRADDYRGKRMRFTADMRASDVSGSLCLWMRVDGERQRSLAFDNMHDRPVTGTTDWQRHDVVLDVAAEARAVAFGVLLEGRGEGWISGVRFEQVGLEVATTGRGSSDLPGAPANLDFAED